MTIEFTCPNCPERYTVPDQLAGRTASCKKCSAQFVIPSPFSRFAKNSSDGKIKASEVLGTSGATISQTGRPFSMVAALGGVALIASVFLPWIQTDLFPIGILGYPEGGIAPIALLMSPTSLDALGVDTLSSLLTPLAKFAFLLIPLAGLVVLGRELGTFSRGAVPRLALLLGAALPVAAIICTAIGFAQSDLRLQDGETVARALTEQTQATVSNPESPIAMATAGMRSARDYLSLGTVVCGLGVVLVLLAAVFTRPGEKAATTAPSAAATGATAAAMAGEEAGTMMFRNETEKAGVTSILQASAAAATTAALATLVKNGHSSASPAERADLAAAAAVGTAAAIEHTLAAVGDSTAQAKTDNAANATEEMAAPDFDADQNPFAVEAPAPPNPEADPAGESEAAMELPAPVAAAADSEAAMELPAPVAAAESEAAMDLPAPVETGAPAGDVTEVDAPDPFAAPEPEAAPAAPAEPTPPEAEADAPDPFADPAPAPAASAPDPFGDPFGDAPAPADTAPDPFATDDSPLPPPPITDATDDNEPGADESFDGLI